MLIYIQTSQASILRVRGRLKSAGVSVLSPPKISKRCQKAPKCTDLRVIFHKKIPGLPRPMSLSATVNIGHSIEWLDYSLHFISYQQVVGIYIVYLQTKCFCILRWLTTTTITTTTTQSTGLIKSMLKIAKNYQISNVHNVYIKNCIPNAK